MEDQLISFETAKLAKEKGCDIPCINVYKGVELYRHKAKRYDNSFNKVWKEEAIKNSVMSNAKTPRYTATTQSLLQKWLREVHKIDICINPHYTTSGDVAGFLVDVYGRLEKYSKCRYSGEGTSFEDALEKGLQESLKLIK